MFLCTYWDVLSSSSKENEVDRISFYCCGECNMPHLRFFNFPEY